MNKLVLVLIIAITMLVPAMAYQQPLTEFGFAPIINTDNSTKSCKETTISLPDNALAEKGAGILSLNATFDGNAWDTTYILVSVNNGEEQVIWPEEFVCNGECWSRIFIPEIKKGETRLKTCAVLGGINKGVEITSKSFIGVYDTPVLSIVNSAPTNIRLGDRAKMAIVVSNKGTKATDIFVQFIHPDTRAKVPITSFDIVEGDSSASTSIAPGETKNFVYYIKPTLVSAYNLPSAALFFKNIFNENQAMLSEHPMMSVVSTKKIEISLVAVSENPTVLKAIVKNNSSEQFDGTITIAPQTKFAQPAQEATISAHTEKEFIFTTNELAKGDYKFFASIRDGNDIYSSNDISQQITKEGLPMQVIIVVIFLVFGAAIFGWIYFAVEKS